jgi:cytochrome c peroxidase
MQRGRWIASFGATALLSVLLAAAADPPLGLDAYMPTPPGNPVTAAKAALGRKLFFDKRLSRDRSISCAVCHDPQLAFSDRQPVAVGIDGRKGTRRTPRLINRAYGRSFFWDGRAKTLEEQALQPIENPLEMDLSLEQAVVRLSADPEYAAAFRQVFQATPEPRYVAMALATYVRTIVSGDSRYDRYVAGEADALNAAERRGLELFRGKASCVVCHLGPNLTDEDFHNTGVGWEQGPAQDLGRARLTEEERDKGAFRTPTLREVASAAPYMHDGSLKTLEDVVDFYSDGGQPNAYLDGELLRLDLTEAEKDDLIAFLRALNGTVREGLQE